MKKFLFIFFFFVVSIGILYGVTNVLAAQTKSDINPFGGTSMESPIVSATGSDSSLLNVLIWAIRWMYTIFFIFAIAMILLAAYNFIRGGSNEKLVETAKKQLRWAIVGIVVALVAVGINTTIKVSLDNYSTTPPQNVNPLPVQPLPANPLPVNTNPLTPVPETPKPTINP